MNINRRTFNKVSTMAAVGSIVSPTMSFGQSSWQDEDMILGHGKFKYKLVPNWAADNFAKYPVKDCHEMVQDRKKRLIFCTNETQNNIIILDKSGKYINSWGHEFPGAHGLTLWNANGEEFLFLTDTNKGEVYKCT